jgi:hypothetical protein
VRSFLPRKLQNIRFGRTDTASALLTAADQSYAATLESYNDGIRDFPDVTAV